MHQCETCASSTQFLFSVGVNIQLLLLRFLLFRCIFSNLRDVALIQQEPETVVVKKSAVLSSWRLRSGRDDSVASPIPIHDSVSSRFRKISDIVIHAAKESDAGVRKSSLLPSTTDVRNVEPDWHSHLPNNVAVAVTSEQGETLELNNKVIINSNFFRLKM